MDDVRKVSVLSARRVRTRQVDGARFQTLLEDLRKLAPSCSLFTVARFGQPHHILQYPSHRVREAIENNDVCRISGTASSGDPWAQDLLKIEIDLGPGSNLAPSSPLFRIEGPKDLVERAYTIIKDDTATWPRTSHGFCHHRVGWLLATFASWLWLAIATSHLIANPGSSEIIMAGASAYMAIFITTILVYAGQIVPFIWFERPGGIVRRRRLWLQSLSVGAAGAIVANLVAAWIAKAFSSAPSP